MLNKIAIVGATGNVGRVMLSMLDERNFPVKEVILLASARSVGKEFTYKGRKLKVQDLETYDFAGTEIALFSAGGAISKVYGEKAAKAGCIVIDNSSFYRTDPEIPLVVPEVNPEAVENFRNKNIIANPNCSTIQLLVALKPMHDLVKIKRIVVSTYQAVSGAGKEGMDELYSQTKNVYENILSEPKKFSKSIVFNAIPQIDIPMDDGSYREEWKMVKETQKILDENIQVSATCVRISVFNCHSESVNVEFEGPIDIDAIREAIEDAPGVLMLDNHKENIFATPKDVAGDDLVYISRLRKDESQKNTLNMWVVGDNLRKGAALNAVQIAELLLDKKLL